MLHSRMLRTGLLCSPALGLQSPIHLGKEVLGKAWGCPPTVLSALKLLRAEDEEVEEALWKIWNFYHHFGDGDILHKERSQNQNQHETFRALTKPFHPALHWSPFISHTSASSQSSSLQPGHSGQGGREGRPHFDPSSAELNLCVSSPKIHSSVTQIP